MTAPTRRPPAAPALLLGRRGALSLLGAALAARALPAAAATGTATNAAPAVERTAAVAPGLYELAPSSTTGLLHVASTGPRGGEEAAILGLDPDTLAVRSRVAMGSDPGFGVAVNDRAGILLTTQTRHGSVAVIDLRSGAVRARIAEGEGAHVRQVLVDAPNDRAFVSVFGFRDKPSAVWVLDTARGAVDHVIAEGLEGGISGLAHDPAGDRLFAADLPGNQIVEISLARRAGVRRFASGGEGPINLALSGSRLFCSNQKSGELVALDAGSGNVIGKAATGAGALGVTLSPDARRLFVANRGAGTVSVLDPADLAVLASLRTGTHPNTVAMDPAGGRAWVSNKARATPRGQTPVADPEGDTVSIIRY